MNNLLAENLRNKRLERGYKQEALALEINMTQAYISYIEKGKLQPTDQKLKVIAHVLGTTPEELKYGVKIEDKNEINPNNQSKNDIGSSERLYEDIEQERQSWKIIEVAKDETIKSQSITIGVLQAELERLKKGSHIL
jgi:transcriptional regulator with XRE-family HTH domain